MSTAKPAPTTVRDFKARAAAGLRRANKGRRLTMTWDEARSVTFPSGMTGFTGWGTVATSDGRSSRFLATADKYGMRVQ